MIIINLELFIIQNKLIKYIKVFVKLYNLKKNRRVYKIYKIVKLGKYYQKTLQFYYLLNYKIIFNFV